MRGWLIWKEINRTIHALLDRGGVSINDINSSGNYFLTTPNQSQPQFLLSLIYFQSFLMEKYRVSPPNGQIFQSKISGKDILSKPQRCKVLERFNKHRRTGEDHLTKHQLSSILADMGKIANSKELQLMSETGRVDQLYFYEVVNQYKTHCEQTDGGLIENVFHSFKETDGQKVEIAKLKQALAEDFGINISDFIGCNKHYLTFQEFKNYFN